LSPQRAEFVKRRRRPESGPDEKLLRR
jgi:hypothetical protein